MADQPMTPDEGSPTPDEPRGSAAGEPGAWDAASAERNDGATPEEGAPGQSVQPTPGAGPRPNEGLGGAAPAHPFGPGDPYGQARPSEASDPYGNPTSSPQPGSAADAGPFGYSGPYTASAPDMAHDSSPYGSGAPYASRGPYDSPDRHAQYPNPGAYGQPGPYGPAGASGSGTYPSQGQPGSYSPYGQPGAYGHGGPYGQPDPYGQAASYGQPGPYGQGGPYGQPGPYGQGGPYGHAGPYGQPGQHDQPGSYGPGGPGGYYSAGYGWHAGPPAPPRRRRSDEERRRLVRQGLVLGGVVVLALGAGIGIGAWIAPTSPATTAHALVSKAVAAATKAGSFHYSELATYDGQFDDIAGDATPTGGRQVIKERGANGTDLFDLRLVNGVVYFRGNEPAVVDQLGVPAARAASVTDKWVSVKKGEGDYSTFAEGITTKSNLAQLPSTFSPGSSAAVAGASPAQTRVSGGLTLTKSKKPLGTADLVITTSTSLPRALSGQISTSTAHVSISWTFSQWRESVKVPVPSDAVPYSSLGATPPKKG